MSEFRDMEIKLFGKTITSLFAVNRCDPSSFSSVQSKEALSSSSSSCSPSLGTDKIPANNKIKDFNEPPKAVSEISSPRNSNNDQQSEITTTSAASVDKSSSTTLKKPDKILPCPRCESSNTKFCYYNNYNVNQPRYFCRNCQRYWTSGGSMRNVAVGSGRRKNKGWAASSNNYLQVTSADYEINNSGTILSFGSSESSITETVKHQSGDTKITAESEEHKKGFLVPQVILPNHPWPYQWSPNANFYPIPFYWGCKVPLWPTSETSTCLGKRSRDQSESLRMNTEPIIEATKRPVWSKTEGFSLFNGFETKGSNRRRLVPETSLNLQVNPAAMSRSMNFRESMQQ